MCLVSKNGTDRPQPYVSSTVINRKYHLMALVLAKIRGLESNFDPSETLEIYEMLPLWCKNAIDDT